MACFYTDKRIGHFNRTVASKKQKCIALSAADFHRAIMEKYQLSKTNRFTFPMMLLLKNGQLNSISTTNIDIQLKLYFDHAYRISSNISKKITNVQQLHAWFKAKKLLSRLKAEKILTKLTINQHVIQRNIHMLSRLSSLTQLHSVAAERRVTARLLQWHQPGSSHLQEMRKETIEKKFVNKYFSLLGGKLPVTTSLYKLLSKGIFKKTSSNLIQTHKIFVDDPKKDKFTGHSSPLSTIPARATLQSSMLRHKTPMTPGARTGSPGRMRRRSPLRNHKHIFTNHARRGPVTLDSVTAPLQRTAVVRKDFGDFSFRRSLKIENIIEEIKKLAVETKKTLTGKALSPNSDQTVELQQHLDINHLSDQIYHNIERRIKLERERRGL